MPPEATEQVPQTSIQSSYTRVLGAIAAVGVTLTVVIAVSFYKYQEIVKRRASELRILEYQVDDPSIFNEVVIYAASWVLLLIISALATLQIKEILNASANNVFRKRANVIAIMMGLVMAIILFKQPFLEELFSSVDTQGRQIDSTRRVIKAILFASGAGAGWMTWYLKHIKTYGEFFHVFLLTAIIGFCWYARLTAPEAVQLTAVAFLLGSLFHIAKDYLDQAHRLEANDSAARPNKSFEPTAK